jgi:flagellar assembly protein FliH
MQRVAQTAKFLFDNDFAAGSSVTRPVPPAEHALKLAEAESKGFREGFAAAETEATAVAARRTAIAFEQIGAALEKISRELAAVETRIETEAVELAVAVARKLAPELVQREPFAEIGALAGECFRQLASAPHVVVRVSDELLATARSRLEDTAGACGFEGRLVVVAEPDIALGDCRIEWADGGVVRTHASTDLAIGKAVSRYLANQRPPGMPELGHIAPGD